MKEKFRSRQRLFGAWVSFSHPSIAEMFSSIMKPDFLGIDMEHSTISQAEAQRIIAATQASGVACFPRVASHNGEQIRRLLDSGADGIMVPMVNSKEEIRQIVEWCKYPPVGKRGFGVSKAQGYGGRYDEYTKSWNEKGVLLVQIESVRGVEAVDEIVANEHVDGVMIGPYDISGSLGIPGKLNDPRVLKACDRVIEACQKYNKACGNQEVDPNEENVRKAFDRGFTFVVLASDLFLIWKWSEKMRNLTGLIRKI